MTQLEFGVLTRPRRRQLCGVISALFPYLHLMPEEKILASGSLDGTVILWNMKEHELLKSTKVISSSSIKSLAFHPNGRILAIGGEDGSLQFRSIPEMKLITTLSGHKKSINDLEFNPRGDLFVSGSEDGNLIIWDWKVKNNVLK